MHTIPPIWHAEPMFCIMQNRAMSYPKFETLILMAIFGIHCLKI